MEHKQMPYLTIETIACDATMHHRLVLMRWVQRAEEALWTSEPPVPVSEKARRKLSLVLFMRLDMIARQILDEMLQKKLSALNPVAALSMEFVSRAEQESAANELLQELLESNCAPFAWNAPLLEGMLDSCANQFVQMSVEMLERIAENQDAISKMLLGGSMGEIIGFSCYGADSHTGGRCAMTVECSSGKFLYKPRDCRVDAIYAKLVDRWFADITYAPRCLSMDGYGFCEFIHAYPANDANGIRLYFHNFGGCAALFHALGSHDLHEENFLACGAKPVLIDIETLLTAKPSPFGEYPCITPVTGFDDALEHSLFFSGLMPLFAQNREFSPLMNRSNEKRGYPSLNGTIQIAPDYEEDFMEGFREIYQRCMDIRDKLSAELEEFTSVHFRRLIRATNYYGLLLKRMYAPAALRSPEAREKAISHLRRYFEKQNASHMFPIADAERYALLRGDIPYFYTQGSSCDLLSDGEIIFAGYFERSALENARIRLARMNMDEMHFEEKVMRECFRAALLPLGKGESLPLETGNPTPLSDECLMTEADGILDKLCAAAVTAPCGEVRWMVNRDNNPSVMHTDLPMGIAGLGAFFAAHHAVSGNAKALQYAGICMDAMETYISEMETAAEKQIKNLTPGIDGAAGLLRALDIMESHFGTKLSNRLMQQLNRLDIENCAPDVFSGVSGLILALGNRNAEVTRRCAETLLNRKTLSQKDGSTLWDTIGKGRAISGMGHGMAGIGAALMQAYDLLGDARYLEAARDAFAWEHSIFSEKMGTWPDLREIGRSGGMHGYCSGAPGIGLALLSCEKYSNILPGYQEMLERAIDACLNTQIQFRDHLCCGNSAALEFLLEAGKKLGREDLLLSARQLASRMVSRRKVEYAYFPPTYQPSFSTSLYYGAAGVGYEMLRLLDSRIPSVLL